MKNLYPINGIMLGNTVLKKVFKILISPFMVALLPGYLIYAFMSFPGFYLILTLGDHGNFFTYFFFPGFVVWVAFMVWCVFSLGYELATEIFGD